MKVRRSPITDELLEMPLMVWTLSKIRINLLNHAVDNLRDICDLLIHVAHQEVVTVRLVMINLVCWVANSVCTDEPSPYT